MAAIPGAAGLLGKGVYCGMPADIPWPVRDGHAVIVGEGAESTAAARELGKAGWRVTIVTRERAALGVRRAWRQKRLTEVVCASGRDYLEALVLRRVDTGRIDACNASMLVVLGGWGG